MKVPWRLSRTPVARTELIRAWAACGLGVALLTGCGGGDGAGIPAAGSAQPLATTSSTSETVDKPANFKEAARFLARATFGPTQADASNLIAIGYEPWLDAQLAMTPTKVRTYVEQNLAANGYVGLGDVINGIWSTMLSDPAQLKQRVAFALSQIFVISLVDGGVHSQPRSAASYYDMLAEKGLGNFRQLLQSVALHPMMGKYLSHRGNQKADPATGRVPDENFARELMQLFTIGLHQLNADGSLRLDANGHPIETYGPDDIAGIAKVFTGWSWSCPSLSDGCFLGASPRGTGDANSDIKPMMGYAKFHSTEEKRFLGVRVPAQSTPNPGASLRVALDTLFNHPNTPPFISKLLIQRLVTSNPSPQYVGDVAAKFIDNGSGVRGDMAAVVRAILLHPDARKTSGTSGKVREPVLRLSAFVRAFPYSSTSGRYEMGVTSDAARQLAQSPLYAPSVFNFFRPGYAAPGSQTMARGLVAPEMQLADDTSLPGYVSFMRSVIERGDVGLSDESGARDVKVTFSKELSLATDPAALVDRVRSVLLYGGMADSFRTELTGIIDRMPMPALAPDKSNQAAVDAAKRKRVNVALLLTIASPEFLVQK